MGNKSFDYINKQKEKYEKIIAEKDQKINELEAKALKLETQYNEIRQELYDVGSGKGTIHKLEKQITSQKRENKTLENKIKELDGSKLISYFSEERQELIRKIKALSFNNSIFNNLAFKFKDGLENVIEIAYRIRTNSVGDMDYFTFVFRDDIVGLFEKMLKVVINEEGNSATYFLVKIISKEYKIPKQYLTKIPNLNNEQVIRNTLSLINIQTTGYHGSGINQKSLKYDKDTEEMVKPDRFLRLSNEDQLTAIFTLLEFMYFVFTNKDSESNLLCIAQNWFKTI